MGLTRAPTLGWSARLFLCPFFRLLVGGHRAAVVAGAHVVVHNHLGVRMTGPALHPARARECEWLLLQYADFLSEHPTIRERLILQSKLSNTNLTGIDRRWSSA